MSTIISISKDGLNEIINKVVKNYLFEYHHVYDNGLYNDALNISNEVINNFKKGWTGKYPIKYRSSSFSNNEYIIYVYLIDSDVSRFEAWSTIRISKSLVEDAINTSNSQKLLSIIYHELGHMVNLTKSNSLGQIRKDIYVPLMLGIKDTDYMRISKILYRFNINEMKARCFETAMYIRQNIDKNISIKDVYDNRCSDITLMRDFVNYLHNCSIKELNDNDKIIINSLYDSLYNKNIIKKSLLSINKKANKLYNFFNIRLTFFKRKIDKIYNDIVNVN